MLINWIELTDFTSHRNSFIEFAPGMNGILGPEGSGKSSVITALGIALFNFNPYNQKNLVRQGCKTAIVTMSFNSLVDQKEYLIQTHLGGSSDTTFSIPSGLPLARGKTDVYNLVKHHLGLPPETDLASLAENGIITRQGELVEPFVKKPGERKVYFSDLLGVDDYELAWEKLRDTAKLIDDKLAGLRESSARLEGELKGTENAKSEIETAQVQRSEKTATLNETQARVAGLREEVRRLEEAAGAIADKRLALARNEGAYTNTKSKLDSVRTMRENFQKQLDGLALKAIFVVNNEGAEAKLAKLDGELQALRLERDHKAGLIAGDIARLQKQIEALSNANGVTCPTCGERLSLQKREQIIADNKQGIHALKHPSSDDRWLQDTILKTEADYKEYNAIVTQLKADRIALTAQPNLEAEVAACNQKIEQLTLELGYIQVEIDHLEDELKNSTFNQTSFDSARSALAEADREAARLTAQIMLLEDSIKKLETKQARHDEIMRELADIERQGMVLTDQKIELAAIREAIRKAGPMIAAQLVASVSMQASAVFSELMREHEQAELEWREDYGLTIRASGTELDLRDDHVNGGKKTKAALAVRTALLDHLGSIGLIVLDEPTNNLEEKSKHLLAQSIGDICSRFGQGIIITHSDEFGSGLNRLVRLTAKDGITEVV